MTRRSPLSSRHLPLCPSPSTTGQNPGVSRGHAGRSDAAHHLRLRAQRPGGQGAAGRPRQHHRRASDAQNRRPPPPPPGEKAAHSPTLPKCPRRHLQSRPHAREPHPEQREVRLQDPHRRHPLPQDGREAPARPGRGGGAEAVHRGPRARAEGAGGQAGRVRAPLLGPGAQHLRARGHQEGAGRGGGGAVGTRPRRFHHLSSLGFRGFYCSCLAALGKTSARPAAGTSAPRSTSCCAETPEPASPSCCSTSTTWCRAGSTRPAKVPAPWVSPPT